MGREAPFFITLIAPAAHRDMNEVKTIHKGSYPITLENMHNPPRKLHMRGNMAESPRQKYLCVVGARKWSTYGKNATCKIIEGLRGYPISIVSGLALGIDSIAHTAALEAGLHCIAFPGSSLEWDEIYPREHIGLAQRIIAAGGALLSQWDKGYATGKWSFPARNVLMAGISHATLVIEAGRGSGSLMTAQHALDFGRDVLAVPGNINGELSYGPHMLIREGGILVSSSAEVIRALGLGEQEDRNDDPRWTSIPLDPLSVAVMKHLSIEEATVDQLADKVGATLASLNEKISILELEGLIRTDDGVIQII